MSEQGRSLLSQRARQYAIGRIQPVEGVMPNDNEQLVRTRTLSWRELAMKAWGKDWTKPEVAYEFSGGRKFEDNREPYQQDDE
jgi:hypothetical protein